MDFNTLLEAALFWAIECINRGEIEFCKVKLEVMRILLRLISASNNPQDSSRRLESFGVHDRVYQRRCSIARRLLREVMESDGGKMAVMRKLEVNYRASLVEELSSFGIVSVEVVVALYHQQTQTFTLQTIQEKLWLLFPEKATTLSPEDRSSIQRQVIELLYAIVSIKHTSSMKQKSLDEIQEILGGYDLFRAVSSNCPILGPDIERVQRMARDVAYPKEGLAPIDDTSRFNSSYALRRCIAMLKFDFALRWFLDSHPELLVEDQREFGDEL